MKIRLVRVISTVGALAAVAFAFFCAETWLDRPLSTHVAVVLGKSADSLKLMPGDARDVNEVSIGIDGVSVAQHYSTGHTLDDVTFQYAMQLKALGWIRSGSGQSIYRKGPLCARLSTVDQTHYAVEFGWRTSWCDPSGLANQTFAAAIALAGLSQLSLAYWITQAAASKSTSTMTDRSNIQMDVRLAPNRMRARGRYERLPAGCVTAVIPSAVSLAGLMVSGIWLMTNIAALQI